MGRKIEGRERLEEREVGCRVESVFRLKKMEQTDLCESQGRSIKNVGQKEG